MTDPRHRLGVAAELAVDAWLERNGWTILARRLRTDAGGEVDLVAIDPVRTLVAIEVRARRGRRTGHPEESVDQRRVLRLRRSLAAFAATSGSTHSGLRVDLVSVQPDAEPGRWRLSRLAGIG